MRNSEVNSTPLPPDSDFIFPEILIPNFSGPDDFIFAKLIFSKFGGQLNSPHTALLAIPEILIPNFSGPDDFIFSEIIFHEIRSSTRLPSPLLP